MPTPDTDSVTVSTTVAVDPATAFAVFTTETDRWWRHGPRFRPGLGRAGTMRFEPGPEGRLVEVYDEASGDCFEFGRVLAWEPGERLAFEMRARAFSPGEKTEVEVRFEPVERGTRVTVTQRGWDAFGPEHPVRHGHTGGAFTSMMGLWWGDLLVSLGARPADSAAENGDTPPVELGYLTLSVTDTKRAAAFYGALFGWEVEPGSLGEGYGHIGNTKLPMGFTSQGPGTWPTLYFRVEDIDAAVAKVRKLGGEAEPPEQSASGWSTECRDDQGSRFAIWQPAEGY